MAFPDDTSLRAQLQEQGLGCLCRGDPQLLEHILARFPCYQAQADALDLSLLLPELSSVPAAVKFNEEASTIEAPAAWACGEGGWGPAYEALAKAVERCKSKIAGDMEEGSPEALLRAESASRGLVAVGRLYKRVEPRHQCKKLTVPGHETLVEFALTRLLRGAARAGSSDLAESACKLLIGSSFDRLCHYQVTRDFDVRKGRGLDEGWVPPPPDADLYGMGCAMLAGPGSPAAIAGCRALLLLTSAERWLVAQATLGLLGSAVVGANDGSHMGPPSPSPLREGLLLGLQQPEAGELQGVLSAAAVIGMLGRCEHPGALLRAGLAAALAKAAGQKQQRPITAALCAYALADLCQEANMAHWAPWYSTPSDEDLAKRMPKSVAESGEAAVEKWWAGQRRAQDSARRMKEEYEAGVEMLKAELTAAGLGMPPNRQAAEPAPQEPAEGQLPWPVSEDEAMAAAWQAVAGSEAKRPRCHAWQSYCQLCKRLKELFREELDGNEPGLYDEFP